MTPARMRLVLAQLHWSQGSLADALGCSPALVRKWSQSADAVPEPVAAYLEALAAAHAAIDPPRPASFCRRPGRPPPTAWGHLRAGAVEPVDGS